MKAVAAEPPAPSLGKWVRADCPHGSRVHCWYRENDLDKVHWEWPACSNGCDAPAEYDSPEDLCEACWKAWWTEGWEN